MWVVVTYVTSLHYQICIVQRATPLVLLCLQSCHVAVSDTTGCPLHVQCYATPLVSQTCDIVTSSTSSDFHLTCSCNSRTRSIQLPMAAMPLRVFYPRARKLGLERELGHKFTTSSCLSKQLAWLHGIGIANVFRFLVAACFGRSFPLG